MSEFWYGLILFLFLMGFGIYLLWRGQRDLTKQLDGRLSQLLEVTEKLARAQGVVAGRLEIEKEQKLKTNE